MKEKKTNKISRSASALWILFSILSLSGCGKDYVTGKSSYNWFSLDTDVKLGAQVLDAQEKSFSSKNVSVDSEKNKEMLARVKTIVSRITKVSHIPDLPYEAHVADAPIVNAWAAPGGKIMVYEGLWDPEKGLVKKGSDDELAAVLSHEIAHCTARHVTKAISRQMTFSLIGTAVSTAIAGAGSMEGSNLFGEVFNQGMNIYVPAYSRKNEAEADRIGLFYMAKAGYDPRAAVEVWKRAAQKKGDRTSIYASHPASGERARDLEKYLPEAMQIYEQTTGKH
ncbi:MAG: M48 family metallopeptidase [bacterium]